MSKIYQHNGHEFTLKPYSIRMLAKYNLQVQLPLGLIVPQKKKEFKEKYNLDTVNLDRYTEQIAELEEIIASFKGTASDEEIETHIKSGSYTETEYATMKEFKAVFTVDDIANLAKFQTKLSDVKSAFANDEQAKQAEYQFMRINDACTIDLLQDAGVMRPLFPELLNGDVSKIDMDLPDYNDFIKEVMLDFFLLIKPKTVT